MGTLKEGEFPEFTFAEEEIHVARMFSSLQEQHIANERTIIAIARTNLAYESGTLGAEQTFLLASEYLRGQLDILRYLLDCSKESKLALVALLPSITDPEV